MQTFLDLPKIHHIHHFMTGPENSYKNLQFILPCKANQAKNIQEITIFVNTVSEIRPIINAIQQWIKKLSYPKESKKCVKPYYLSISDWNKSLILNTFKIINE